MNILNLAGERCEQIFSEGDAWTFIALERTSKLVVAWHLGKRDRINTEDFVSKIWWATALGWFDVSTDAFQPYETAIHPGLRAAPALHFWHHNFARTHSALRITPAMAANVRTMFWSFQEAMATLLTPLLPFTRFIW